jgi:hypothetical protein
MWDDVSNQNIRIDDGFEVRNYIDLAEKVSAVQYINPNFNFLYRGQSKDYKRLNKTTIKPTIFRDYQDPHKKTWGLPSQAVLERRYRRLLKAEDEIVRAFSGRVGQRQISRNRLIRWSIIQHYEICETPLLDLTHSLRVAASFASREENEFGYIFVFAIPEIAGAITSNSSTALQVIKLSTACPPDAKRPHLQEGYLISHYPEIGEITKKYRPIHYENDFAVRIIAKFKFRNREFWNDSKEFVQISNSQLYPNKSDFMYDIAQRVEDYLDIEQ